MGREHWCHRTFFFFLNLLLRLEPLSDLKGHTKSFPLNSGSLKGFLFSLLFKLEGTGKPSRRFPSTERGKHQVRKRGAEEWDALGQKGTERTGEAPRPGVGSGPVGARAARDLHSQGGHGGRILHLSDARDRSGFVLRQGVPKLPRREGTGGGVLDPREDVGMATPVCGKRGPAATRPCPLGNLGRLSRARGRRNSSSKPLTHRSHTQRLHNRLESSPGPPRAAYTRSTPRSSVSDAKLPVPGPRLLRPPTAGASAPAAAAASSAFSARQEQRGEGSAPGDRDAPRERGPPSSSPPRCSCQPRLRV